MFFEDISFGFTEDGIGISLLTFEFKARSSGVGILGDIDFVFSLSCKTLDV